MVTQLHLNLKKKNSTEGKKNKLNSFCALLFLSGPLQMMVVIITTVAIIPDSKDAVKIKWANT